MNVSRLDQPGGVRRYHLHGELRITFASLMTAFLLATLGLVPPMAVSAQTSPSPSGDSLDVLAFLEGTWTGSIDGTAGPSTARRAYQFILGERFLLMRHDRDPEAAASPDNADEEWSIFSFDRDRAVIMLREFLVEGLVNTYRCEIDEDRTQFACETDTSEGGSGLMLRLRYEFNDFDDFVETFEVFGSDGAREARIESRWIRSRR